MGWDYTHAIYYKKDGTIDRKAELDSVFTWESERKRVTVVKSAMVKSVYYAAIMTENLTNGTKCIGGAVCPTSTDRRQYYNFGYKIMDESMGPYYYDCPINILNLLSDTDDEYAIKWRENCRRKAI